MATTIITVKDVECRVDSVPVVKSLSLHVNQGTLTCLLGPSGCGKTTLLRAIAGFENIYAGTIVLRDQVVSRPGFTLPPEKRNLSMVFQDYALFPHLTVRDNICFGIRHKDPQEQKQTIDRLMEMMELPGLQARYPHELSGGQQQRIALARALAPKPDLILMDEPFSNLDVDLRERLRQKVRVLLKEQNSSCILVTHDQQEAFAISDIMGVMDAGQILQWDTPFNLYHEPHNRFIADFIGPGTFLSGDLIEPDEVDTELGRIRGDRAYQWPRNTKVDVLFRPDDIVVEPQSDLRAQVLGKTFKGAQILYTLKLQTGSQLLALFPSHHNYDIGENVGIKIEADHLVVFAARD